MSCELGGLGPVILSSPPLSPRAVVKRKVSSLCLEGTGREKNIEVTVVM